MFTRLLLALATAAFAFFPLGAGAATSAQLVTPQAVSVAGGESQVFSVRFYDALGHPAVGETVQFFNDACGSFSNGGFLMNVPTDATGMASVDFTAMSPAGITCWVTASAGVQARFDVHTYQPPTVYFSIATEPATPRPGQEYRLVVSAMTGAYRLFNVDIGARVVGGTASAAIMPTIQSSGQMGSVQFLVTPDGRMGDYEIEVSHHGKVQRVAMNAPASPWQDMWWVLAGVENGWGMSIVQHRDMLFSVIYAYDGAGKPTWYVIPTGTWNDAHTVFTGPVYVPHGSPYSAYDTTRFVPGDSVGSVTLTFTSATTASLDYTINGVSGHKNLTRQPFGPLDSTATALHGDMWWGGASQDGWGIAILQQFRTLFGVWFTYDAAGAPTWFVMPGGSWSDAGTYAGRIYRTAGSPWLGRAYDLLALRVTDVGTFRITFAGDTATFAYTIDGQSGTLPLTRQPF